MRLISRKFGLALSLGVIALGFAQAANAATTYYYQWTGVTDSDLTKSTNWTTGRGPATFNGTYDLTRLYVTVTQTGTPAPAKAPLIYTEAQGHTTYSTTAARALYVQQGEMQINGGTFETCGAVNPDAIGYSAYAATLTINGGNYLNTGAAASNGFIVHYMNTGDSTLNVMNGTFAANYIAFNATASNAPNSSGNATVNLENGGVIETGAVYEVANATSTMVSTFNFNGGTLKARVAGSFSGLDYAYVKTGGAIIDTNSLNYAIGQNLLAGTEGSGGLTKNGEGKLTITSAGNTYTGATAVNLGKLVVNGSIAASSGVSVAAGASLGGSGTVSVISGAGSVGPGSSPGILTASSIDPSAGTDFAFELTAAAPTYSSATASGNDVLHLTGATPIASALTSENVVDVYLGVASVAAGDSFLGGFYEDAATDFTSAISGASYNFFVLGDGAGTHAYNGTNYYTLGEYNSALSVDVATVASTADFATGTVNGGVTQFTIAAVPEPATAVMLLGGLLGLVAYAWRKRK
ncbi:MAG: PEP-CTERM sorting domain-containing protein [Thermoguttaceae bacterium]